MDPIFIYRDNQEYGPFTEDEARNLLIAGNIVENDFARTASSTEWNTVSELLPSPEVVPQIETLPDQSGVKSTSADQPTRVGPPPLPAQISPPTSPPANDGPPAVGGPLLVATKTSGYGTTALVLSLFSLTGCLGFLALPAVILAHLERAKGNRTQTTTATLIMGYGVLGIIPLCALLVKVAQLTQADAGPTNPSSLFVTTYNPENSAPEGPGNMRGDTGFKSLDDVRSFFGQGISALPPTMADDDYIDLENSYLKQGHAVTISPGSYQITGIFDRKGRKTSLVAEKGLLVSSTDNMAPCFQIKDGDNVYYVVWSFRSEAEKVDSADESSQHNPWVGSYVSDNSSSVPGVLSLDINVTLELHDDYSAKLDAETRGSGNVAIKKGSEIRIGHWSLDDDGRTIKTEWDTYNKDDEVNGSSSGNVQDGDFKIINFNALDSDNLQELPATGYSSHFVRLR